MSKETGGPAFPEYEPDYMPIKHGMTLRQYAAIKLKVPDSGEDWLDDMILASLRDDFALALGTDDYVYAYNRANKALEARK